MTNQKMIDLAEILQEVVPSHHQWAAQRLLVQIVPYTMTTLLIQEIQNARKANIESLDPSSFLPIRVIAQPMHSPAAGFKIIDKLLKLLNNWASTPFEFSKTKCLLHYSLSTQYSVLTLFAFKFAWTWTWRTLISNLNSFAFTWAVVSGYFPITHNLGIDNS